MYGCLPDPGTPINFTSDVAEQRYPELQKKLISPPKVSDRGVNSQGIQDDLSYFVAIVL
jgi:hypothetical protein